MNSILILGAGVMQGPAIRAAKDKGYRVFVADGDPKAVHAQDADQFLHIDLKDEPALVSAAREIADLKGVFTAGTDFSASVARVAEELGLPGIDRETALNASDKARMRERLAAAGVPVPRFRYGSSSDDALSLVRSILQGGASFPLVVKPVDNMGARGCRMVRDEAELVAAWADAVSHSRSGRAIIEEYLDGPEFSVDALVHEGRITIRGIADRIVDFPPYFVELGHTMPSAYDPSVQDEVIAVFKAGVKALGIRCGAAKGDIKYTRAGAFVGEIAARLSGGYMSGWTYPYASGINPVEDGIALACGEKPSLPDSRWECVSAERAFISIPGIVSAVRGVDEARRLPSIKDVFLRIKAGDRVRFPVNNVQKAGNVISQERDRKAAECAAESAARSILVRLAPGEPETRAFLGNGGMDASYGWVPPAYRPSAMVLGYVSSLPDVLKREKTIRSVSVAPVPGAERETGRDWQGRSITEALAAVETLCGARLGLDGDLVLGRSFWEALFKGGYQGATWIVDTMLSGLEKP